MKRIIAIRHAESKKNIEGIYGGSGKKITENGLEQIAKKNQILQEKYDLLNENSVKIYSSCNRLHVIETGKKIADFFKVDDVLLDERYSPIRLGVFDGLSKEEQRLKFPDAVKALENWNCGIGDINDFIVEGLESSKEHYLRIKAFLESLENETVYILIGTRSDISAIKNIVLGNDPDVYMQYKYYETDYLGGIYFEIDDNNVICNVKYL